VETLAELDKGGLLPETPKSRAGKRTVAFPAELVPELRWHLERFAEPGKRGVVFVGPKGGRLRRSNFRKIWSKARALVGLPDLHFHDLRHAGNTQFRDRRDPQGADGPARSLQRAGPSRGAATGPGAGQGKPRPAPRKATAPRPVSSPARASRYPRAAAG
jgi:Phage integrase family